MNFRKKISTDTASINLMLSSKVYKINQKYAQYSIPIKKGKYLVTLTSKSLKKTHTEYIEVNDKDDFLLLGDSLYYSERKYKKYDGGANLYGEGCLLSLGHDGDHWITVEVKKIKKAPKNEYEEAIKLANSIYKKAKSLKIKDMKEYDSFNKNIKALKKEYYESKLIRRYSHSRIINRMGESFDSIRMSATFSLTKKLFKKLGIND